MHDHIASSSEPGTVQPVTVQPGTVQPVAAVGAPAEGGRSAWALLGLFLAVSAAITIMALGISAG